MIKHAILFTAILSANAFGQTAQTTPPQPGTAMPRDEKIDLVAVDLRALSRIATLATDLNGARQVITAIAHGDIETLRERRENGTYRWASLQREEGGRVKDQKAIERVQSEKELREVTLTAPNGYRVEVSLPTKRSLVAANNRVFIRNVLVDSTGFDGKVTHAEIPVNAWVNPGDANGTALPEIGKSVKVTVELGVESGEKRAVADVALLEAKLTDDPTSPYFPAVQRLQHIREVLVQKDLNRGFLKSTTDEGLLSLPGEMEKRTTEQAAAIERRKQAATTGETKGGVASGDATPDVVAALQEVSHLLGGTLQDQTDARAKLKALIDSLQKK